MASSQSVRDGQVPVNCKLCETDRSLQWKCMDCGILMCGHCKDKVHSQFKNAQDHKIISREDIGLHREELDFNNIKCHEHAGRSSCLYCNTCEILVCSTCIAKSHKKHDLIEISEAYNIKVEVLKKNQGKMLKSNTVMNAKKEELNNLVSDENSKYSEVKQNMLSHENTVKEQVDQYFKDFKNKLDRSHETALTSVKSDISDILLFTNQTEDKMNEVQDFIGLSNASQFFNEVKIMEKSTNIQVPQTKPIYSFSPIFVPGYITQSNIGLLQDDGSLSAEKNISLVINNEYQPELESITFLRICLDQSMWMCSGKFGVLQRVKPEGSSLKVMSIFAITVYGMALNEFNQLLLCVEGKTSLQQISSNGDLVGSVYDVDPLYPIVIHVINENRVIVGAYDAQLERYSLIIMNKKGDKETVYERDKHNQPLVSHCTRITSTSNENLHVVDKISQDRNGRVVVLGQGDIINEYTGHATINKRKSFKPVDIVPTPNDNVLVMDLYTYILHILNDNGDLVSYCNLAKIGIKYPRSLAFNTTGQLYIGCTRASGSKTKKAKIYEINIGGF